MGDGMLTPQFLLPIHTDLVVDLFADNRESSADMLRQAGIAFQSNNAGAHLVVNHGGVTVDFWPGTGLWCIRGSIAKHRGVNRLLSRLHAQENS